MPLDYHALEFRHSTLERLLVDAPARRVEMSFTAVHSRKGVFDWRDVTLTLGDVATSTLNANQFVHGRAWIDAVSFSRPRPDFDQELLRLEGRTLTIEALFGDCQLEFVAKEQGSPKAMPATAYIHATLVVRPTEEDGRHGPFWTGYRPSWWIGHFHEGRRAFNDAELYLRDREWAFPGETVPIALRPLSPEYWQHLQIGSEIAMHEGPREFGRATITRIGNADL